MSSSVVFNPADPMVVAAARVRPRFFGFTDDNRNATPNDLPGPNESIATDRHANRQRQHLADCGTHPFFLSDRTVDLMHRTVADESRMSGHAERRDRMGPCGIPVDTAPMMNDSAQDRYRQAARILHDVAKPMRVLSALAWPGELREKFLAGGADKLPEPTYAPIDPIPVIEGVDAARRLLRPGNVVDDWLDREATSIESTALMLSSLGTPAFHAYSRRLYGVPSQPLRYDPATPLDLARKVHEAIDDLQQAALLRPVLRTTYGRGSCGLHRRCREGPLRRLGPRGAARRRTLCECRCLDEQDQDPPRRQVHPEGRFPTPEPRGIHPRGHRPERTARRATSRSWRSATPAPREPRRGLAVYSEYVSGTLGMDRLRRLADRILATQLVIDGADFIELYRWFLDRSADPEQAFESARRIFRGAPMTGGAPFTKDCAYLSGYLQVATFVHAAFRAGRADTIGLLFAGKLDLFAIPALGELRSQGLVRPAQFAPPWATDPGWILSHLTLMTFMADIDLAAVTDAIADVLEHCPRVEVHLPESAGE